MKTPWILFFSVMSCAGCESKYVVGETTPAVVNTCSDELGAARMVEIRGEVGRPFLNKLNPAFPGPPEPFVLDEKENSFFPSSLPGGLTFSPDGFLSGVPVSVGMYRIPIRQKDSSSGCIARWTLNLMVEPRGLQLFPLSRPIRLVDTRSGQQGCAFGSPKYQIPVDLDVNATVAGIRCDVDVLPSNAKAVWLNVTYLEKSFRQPWPASHSKYRLSYEHSNSIKNHSDTLLVRLDENDGTLMFPMASRDVVVDVLGYLAEPAEGGMYFHPLRKPILVASSSASDQACQTVSTGGASNMKVTGLCDNEAIPESARAVMGTLVIQPNGNDSSTRKVSMTAADLITQSGTESPHSMSYSEDTESRGRFLSTLDANGRLAVTLETASNFSVDIRGYFSAEPMDSNGAGLLFRPVKNPFVLFDTHPDSSHSCHKEQPGGFSNNGYPPGSIIDIQATGTCFESVIPDDAFALEMSVSHGKYSPGLLSIWPQGGIRPTIPTAFRIGKEDGSRSLMVLLNPANGQFSTHQTQEGDFILDVIGYYSLP